MSLADLLPPGFAPTPPPAHARFEFAVLTPAYNASDLAAWTSSMAHIQGTPGFGNGWPERVYTLAENEADLTEHAEHHAARIDFAWTILAPGTAEVIGCLYVKPSPTGPIAKSWLRVDHAQHDAVLRCHVQTWLDQWPIPVTYLG